MFGGDPCVGVINIQEPTRNIFLAGLGPACYSADLEFYATEEGATVSATPILHYDEIPKTGVQVLVGLGAASVLGGPQAGMMHLLEARNENGLATFSGVSAPGLDPMPFG